MLHGISTGDWHLDALKSHFPNDHVDKQLVEIEKIYKYAIEKGISHVFVNGDVFDASKSPIETCIKLLKLLNKYDKHVTTHILAGNHDWADIHKTSLDFLIEFVNMKMFKNLYVYKDLSTKTIEGINVNFIPHGTKEAPKSKVASLNFIHQSVKGAVGDNGRTIKVKDEDDFSCKERDFTFAGHVHQYQIVENKRLVYSGSPYQKTFGERLPKGYVEFTAEMKGKKLVVKQKFVQIKPNFELRTVLIKKQKDFGKLSNSYNVRLRVFIVGEDVVVPTDLTRSFPNVAAVLDSKGKKVSENESSVKLSKDRVAAMPKINPTRGLKGALKRLGHSKGEVALAKSIVNDALVNAGMK